MEIRVAIVGSRIFDDYKLLEKTMDSFVIKHGIPNLVVSGGAKGADTLGELWAKKNGIKTLIFKPEWKKHGKAAGIIRNGDIVNEATHMVAFVKGKSKGTKDSTSKAKKLGIPIIEVMVEEEKKTKSWFVAKK